MSHGASPHASRPQPIQRSRVHGSEEIVRSFVESMSSYAHVGSLRGHQAPGRLSLDHSVELAPTPHSLEVRSATARALRCSCRACARRAPSMPSWQIKSQRSAVLSIASTPGAYSGSSSAPERTPCS